MGAVYLGGPTPSVWRFAGGAVAARWQRLATAGVYRDGYLSAAVTPNL